MDDWIVYWRIRNRGTRGHIAVVVDSIMLRIILSSIIITIIIIDRVLLLLIEGRKITRKGDIHMDILTVIVIGIGINIIIIIIVIIVITIQREHILWRGIC